MKIQIELAEKLKEAGWPQTTATGELFFSTIDRKLWMKSIVDTHSDDEMIACPRLSELIEACGDEFRGLEKNGSAWIIHAKSPIRSTNDWIGGNVSPEEAVANLWLALNAK